MKIDLTPLYSYCKRKNFTNLTETEKGFSFTLNEKNYDVEWDEDSICNILIENGDYDDAYEVSVFDLQTLK